MSLRRVRKHLTCGKCGSDLAGRFVKTVTGKRQGMPVTIDVYKCRCGGGRRIARAL